MISYHAGDDGWCLFVIFEMLRTYSAYVGGHVRSPQRGDVRIILRNVKKCVGNDVWSELRREKFVFGDVYLNFVYILFVRRFVIFVILLLGSVRKPYSKSAFFIAREIICPVEVL